MGVVTTIDKHRKTIEIEFDERELFELISGLSKAETIGISIDLITKAKSTSVKINVLADHKKIELKQSKILLFSNSR
ncbi:MAG: hypothetical protein H6622_14930 [Halobacteriovoraceae bacterium]|nr:hypothetical protein [Halobacteriovoraceae bacterium]